jgi:hypothetical protein
MAQITRSDFKVGGRLAWTNSSFVGVLSNAYSGNLLTERSRNSRAFFIFFAGKSSLREKGRGGENDPATCIRQAKAVETNKCMFPLFNLPSPDANAWCFVCFAAGHPS